MKVIKPLRLSIIQRPYRWQQQDHMGVAVMALLDMGPAPRLRPEQELWQLVASELQASGGVPDLALPKVCPEFLATGYGWTRHQQDKRRCVVRVQVGDKEKALQVSGDRVWQNDSASEPLPFDRLPLDWAHAFGGPEFAENPVGFGAVAEHIDERDVHRLPNVELLSQLTTSLDRPSPPASFTMLPFALPRRQKLMGQAWDEEWQQHEYPGFARDTDWRIFNQAEQDQWWHDRDRLPPGAAWRIDNMHPEKASQQGTLPLWQARCFIQRQRLEETLFEEIPLRATTVHFFPHLEQMILIWHGSTRVNEDDLADILTLMPALERQDAPRSVAHYQQILQQRTQSENAVLYALREKDLLPESAIGPWGDTDAPIQHSPYRDNLARWQQQIREQQREQLAARGMDIDDILPAAQRPEPPPLDDLPDYIEQREREAEQKQNELMAAGDNHPSSVDDSTLPGAAENYRQQRQMLDDKRELLNVTDEQHAKTHSALYQSYLMSAHHQNGPTRLTPEQSQLRRQQLLEIMATDGDCSGMDFTGADLSALDLRGVDFSRALLENTDFSYCQLDQANFSEAVLVRAEFHHSSLKEVLFDRANLSLAQCYHSDFSGASFTEVQTEDIQLEHCIFDRALLSELMIDKAVFAHCRFHHALIEKCVLLKLSLNALDFSHATLQATSFVECRLREIVFSQASVSTLTLVTCDAPGISFQGAQLHSCSFVSDCVLKQSSFIGATLIECNLRQQDLYQTRFTHARLENSDLSEADCRQAEMQRMTTVNCRFVRTRFQGAWLTDSNLSGAIMQKSLLSGCDMRGCNLFRTDLSQSESDDATLFEDAWTSGSKTLPRRKREWI